MTRTSRTEKPSRRTRDGRRLVLCLLLPLVLIAAACGGDDDDGGASGETASTQPTADGGTTAAASDVDPAGVLTVMQSLLPQNVLFDPVDMLCCAQLIGQALYDTLLHRNGDGQYEPGLAASATIVDPSTIEIELRPDLVFSDGTPLDAEALKFNLERNAQGQGRGGLRIDILNKLESVEVTGPISVTVHLSQPIAGLWYTLLADTETHLVSPAAVEAGQDMNTEPVGAGPFVLDELVPEERLVMVKNPDYWDADNVKLAGITFLHTADTNSTINALRGGQGDLAPFSDLVAGGELDDPVTFETIPTTSIYLLNMCKREGPLADVRVRQALAYAVDRQAISDRLYAGQAEPAWSLRPEGDLYHNPDLEGIYERDLDRAKALLAEAGYADGFDITMFAGVGSAAAQELMQANFAEIGVNVDIQRTQNVFEDFYFANRPGTTWPTTHTRAGLDAWTILFGEGVANVCNHQDPELNELLAEAMTYPPNSEEAVPVWHALSEKIVGEALVIPLVFHVQGEAYNSDRVGGVEWYINSTGQFFPSLTDIYIKAS